MTKQKLEFKPDTFCALTRANRSYNASSNAGKCPERILVLLFKSRFFIPFVLLRIWCLDFRILLMVLMKIWRRRSCLISPRLASGLSSLNWMMSIFNWIESEALCCGLDSFSPLLLSMFDIFSQLGLEFRPLFQTRYSRWGRGHLVRDCCKCRCWFGVFGCEMGKGDWVCLVFLSLSIRWFSMISLVFNYIKFVVCVWLLIKTSQEWLITHKRAVMTEDGKEHHTNKNNEVLSYPRNKCWRNERSITLCERHVGVRWY